MYRYFLLLILNILVYWMEQYAQLFVWAYIDLVHLSWPWVMSNLPNSCRLTELLYVLLYVVFLSICLLSCVLYSIALHSLHSCSKFNWIWLDKKFCLSASLLQSLKERKNLTLPAPDPASLIANSGSSLKMRHTSRINTIVEANY